MQKSVVLFCINNLGFGGAERLVVDDVNEALKQGYDVSLLTLRKEPRLSIAGDLILSKEKWQAIYFDSFFDIPAWIRTIKFLRKLKPNKVFTNLWFTNTIVRIAARLVGVKNMISFEHNIYDSVKTRKMYFIDRSLQGWCKKIVAVSSAVKSSLISHGIRKDKIVVINNGIDVSKFSPKSDFGLKTQLGLPQNAFMFLSIGRLIEQKGMDILIEAFSKLDKDAYLIIVGQGENEYKLKKQVKDLKIHEKVLFLGVRDDVPKLLSVSDCFVLASRWEGLGIVVLEAMATGKPIIISDFEAGRDMITDGVDGLVVRKGDPEDLTQAMNKIISNNVLRKNLAQRAREKSEKFSIENHLNKLLSL